MRGPSPYKGHPKSEWPKIKAELEAKRVVSAPGIEPTVDISPSSDVIPPNLFSGDQKTLEVMSPDGDAQNPIPGFWLYWMNDVDVRIAKAIKSGYQFVERDEVMLNDGLVSGDDVAGNHVRKLVGGGPDGKPMYAYLMKKPLHIKAAHDLEYQKVNERLQELVDRGRMSRNPEDRQYSKATNPASSLPEISRNSKIYR